MTCYSTDSVTIALTSFLMFSSDLQVVTFVMIPTIVQKPLQSQISHYNDKHRKMHNV